jgi:hypothetical protein
MISASSGDLHSKMMLYILHIAFIIPRQPLVLLLAPLLLVLLALLAPYHRHGVHGLIPLLDGSRAMPKMYCSSFDKIHCFTSSFD